MAANTYGVQYVSQRKNKRSILRETIIALEHLSNDDDREAAHDAVYRMFGSVRQPPATAVALSPTFKSSFNISFTDHEILPPYDGQLDKGNTKKLISCQISIDFSSSVAFVKQAAL